MVALFILVSATGQYFFQYYGIVLDRSMITNIVGTTPAESLALLTPEMLLVRFPSGVVMAALAFWPRFIKTFSLWTCLASRGLNIALSVMLIALVAMLPWSIKGAGKASIIVNWGCSPQDARSRRISLCAPARCGARARRRRRWWTAHSPAAASPFTPCLSENLPVSQLAWGKITSSGQITAILTLLTEKYDLGNDVLYTARKRGSILLNAMLQGAEQGVNKTADSLPDTRWLLLVAHDTNIAMVRTLMGFSWTLPGYTRGNIPPGSSLVFERWRDRKSGERFMHVYFQAQRMDDLRHLQTVDQTHPLLREEWRQPGCRVTDVGTICPMKSTVRALSKNLDRHAITPVDYSAF